MFLWSFILFLFLSFGNGVPMDEEYRRINELLLPKSYFKGKDFALAPQGVSSSAFHYLQ